MASIQKITSALTGEISYRAQVRVKGHTQQSQTFPNKKEAQQWATSIEAAIRESRYFPQARAARTSLNELIERYSREVLLDARPSERITQQ